MGLSGFNKRRREMNDATKQTQPAPSESGDGAASAPESKAASQLRKLRKEFEAEYQKDLESLGVTGEEDSQAKGKRARKKSE